MKLLKVTIRIVHVSVSLLICLIHETFTAITAATTDASHFIKWLSQPPFPFIAQILQMPW